MGMGYCETNESKGESGKFVIPEFTTLIDEENNLLHLDRQRELDKMLRETLDKKKIERSKYFSIRSVAKTLKCDHSALRRWISSHGIKTKKIIMPLSNGQTSSVLTKDQVQYIMENRG